MYITHYCILFSTPRFPFVGLRMALKIFLSKTPKMVSSDFDNTQVSEPHACTGLIKVVYNFTLFFMDKTET